MHEELTPYHYRTSPVAPSRVVPWARWRSRRELARFDRHGAALARAHGEVSLLADAQFVIDLGWAAGTACTVCARDARKTHLHGGAHGVGSCLAGALALASRHDRAALLRATDLVWLTLYREGHRPLHWNSPGTRQALQVADLRSWNDSVWRTSDEVLALLRAAHRTATATLDRTRADAPKPADASR